MNDGKLELLPCPFCGCVDVSVDDNGDYEWLKCDWCGAIGGVDPDPEFEEHPIGWHWNRRAAMANEKLNAVKALEWVERGNSIKAFMPEASYDIIANGSKFVLSSGAGYHKVGIFFSISEAKDAAQADYITSIKPTHD